MAAAAAFLVNPTTSWAFAEMTRRAGARAILLSAGASQVSRGVLALCRKQGVDVVLIVRRHSQIAEMKAAGATEVLDQTTDGFAARLHEVCARLRPTLFFDAVGEDLTATAMEALPDGAEIIVYGLLDTGGRGLAQASVPALIFRDLKSAGSGCRPTSGARPCSRRCASPRTSAGSSLMERCRPASPGRRRWRIIRPRSTPTSPTCRPASALR
ncbi:MAG: zinc-binding dehydrogenase [Hyphomicrobium sp.]